MWIRLSLVVAALLLLTFSVRMIYDLGKASGREATLARSIEILRERSQVDEAVKNMGDDSLCRALGGVYANGTCQ